MKHWRKTIRNLGKILQEFEMNAVVNSVLSAISSIASVYLSGLSVLSVWTVFLTAILLVCFYIIIHVLIKMLNIIGGKLIRFSEKWYPEWLYSPKIEYYLGLGHGNTLTLYIKSLPKNKQAHLKLEFSRLRFINAMDHRKQLTDVGISNVRNKRLYEKEIDSNDKRTVTISGKSRDGRDMLSFPFDIFGIELLPGKYIYEFHERGTHKGVDFDRKTIRLEFVYNDKGEFEL